MHNPLSVEVRGELIVVTQPDATFAATYGKAWDEPKKVLLAVTEGHGAEQEAISKFRAEAFEAAFRTARELGWIV
jgi:hypothetical protein